MISKNLSFENLSTYHKVPILLHCLGESLLTFLDFNFEAFVERDVDLDATPLMDLKLVDPPGPVPFVHKPDPLAISEIAFETPIATTAPHDASLMRDTLLLETPLVVETPLVLETPLVPHTVDAHHTPVASPLPELTPSPSPSPSTPSPSPSPTPNPSTSHPPTPSPSIPNDLKVTPEVIPSPVVEQGVTQAKDIPLTRAEVGPSVQKRQAVEGPSVVITSKV